MTQGENGNDIMTGYLQHADEEIAAAVTDLDQKRKQFNPNRVSDRPSLVNKVARTIATLIITQIEHNDTATNLEAEVYSSLSVPPARKDYPWKPDFGLHALKIAHKIGVKNPVAFAEQLGSTAKNDELFSDSGNIGPYVNLRINEAELHKGLLEIQEHAEAPALNGKVALIDFSSPNISKPFGINHLRPTIIGEAIAGIKEEAGYLVVRDNHLGDWGTQFGNLLAAHDEFGDEKPFEDLSTDELNELYVRFSKEKKDRPELVFKGREYFRRLSEKDPELINKWYAAVVSSRAEFDEMYDRLGISFDTQIGEAYFEKDAEKLIAELEHNPAKSSKGNIVFGQDGSAYIDGEHPVILRTQDGYCVYAARDLATVIMRTDKFQPDEIIYVVGEEQSTSFSAMFETAQNLGLDSNHADLVHAEFGLLLDKTKKKLSTRKGTSGKLSDLLNELENRSFQNLLERNGSESQESLAKNAKILGQGALIWNDLQNDRKKSSVFDPERMLEMGTGGVIDSLYAIIRSKKILEKFNDTNAAASNTLDHFTNDAEHDLAVMLCDFRETIKKAADANAPHILVTYLQVLSKRHGAFYEQSPVAKEKDEATRNTRLLLHKAFVQTMEKALACLNIQTPDYL